MVGVTLLRGILSPVGHGTWTAILASVLFRESAAGHFRINGKVVEVHLMVVSCMDSGVGCLGLFQRFFHRVLMYSSDKRSSAASVYLFCRGGGPKLGACN